MPGGCPGPPYPPGLRTVVQNNTSQHRPGAVTNFAKQEEQEAQEAQQQTRGGGSSGGSARDGRGKKKITLQRLGNGEEVVQGGHSKLELALDLSSDG
jgi:hypothetical protein